MGNGDGFAASRFDDRWCQTFPRLTRAAPVRKRSGKIKPNHDLMAPANPAHSLTVAAHHGQGPQEV
jgi:hypothetical protein